MDRAELKAGAEYLTIKFMGLPPGKWKLPAACGGLPFPKFTRTFPIPVLSIQLDFEFSS